MLCVSESQEWRFDGSLILKMHFHVIERSLNAA